MPGTVAPAARSGLLRSSRGSAVLSERELLELLEHAGDLLEARGDVIEAQGGCPEVAASYRDLKAKLHGQASETVRNLFRQIRVSV